MCICPIEQQTTLRVLLMCVVWCIIIYRYVNIKVGERDNPKATNTNSFLPYWLPTSWRPLNYCACLRVCGALSSPGIRAGEREREGGLSTWIGGKEREEEGEREEEEAKAAAAYSLWLQQTGDEALFFRWCLPVRAEELPSNWEEHTCNLFLLEPRASSLSRRPLEAHHIYSNTYSFSLRIGISQPCRLKHVSHPFSFAPDLCKGRRRINWINFAVLDWWSCAFFNTGATALWGLQCSSGFGEDSSGFPSCPHPAMVQLPCPALSWWRSN